MAGEPSASEFMQPTAVFESKGPYTSISESQMMPPSPPGPIEPHLSPEVSAEPTEKMIFESTPVPTMEVRMMPPLVSDEIEPSLSLDISVQPTKKFELEPTSISASVSHTLPIAPSKEIIGYMSPDVSTSFDVTSEPLHDISSESPTARESEKYYTPEPTSFRESPTYTLPPGFKTSEISTPMYLAMSPEASFELVPEPSVLMSQEPFIVNEPSQSPTPSPSGSPSKLQDVFISPEYMTAEYTISPEPYGSNEMLFISPLVESLPTPPPLVSARHSTSATPSVLTAVPSVSARETKSASPSPFASSVSSPGPSPSPCLDPQMRIIDASTLTSTRHFQRLQIRLQIAGPQLLSKCAVNQEVVDRVIQVAAANTLSLRFLWILTDVVEGPVVYRLNQTGLVEIVAEANRTETVITRQGPENPLSLWYSGSAVLVTIAYLDALSVKLARGSFRTFVNSQGMVRTLEQEGYDQVQFAAVDGDIKLIDVERTEPPEPTEDSSTASTVAAVALGTALLVGLIGALILDAGVMAAQTRLSPAEQQPAPL